jgi:hypothetical protein
VQAVPWFLLSICVQESSEARGAFAVPMWAGGVPRLSSTPHKWFAYQLKRLPKNPPASYSSVSVAHWWNCRSEAVAEAFSRSSEFRATTY